MAFLNPETFVISSKNILFFSGFKLKTLEEDWNVHDQIIDEVCFDADNNAPSFRLRKYEITEGVRKI
jgi:hypothetical protein